MDMELLFLYAPGCLVLILSSMYLLGLYANSRRDLPPGPLPLPLVGSLFSLGALSHRALARLAERHGPVMALRLGTVTTIVASSADAAREVLQRHDAALSGRWLPDGTEALAHSKHSMVLLPTGSPRWRALRKVCSGELFAPHRLDTHGSVRRDKVRRLLSQVARLARDGAPVGVGCLVFVTSLDLLSSTLFSTDLADIVIDDSSFKGVLRELTRTADLHNVWDFFPAVLARLDPRGLRRRLLILLERLLGTMDKQIERRLQERAAATAVPKKENSKDFLDVLLDYRGAEDGRDFDRQTLTSLLADLVNAGTETSSLTVEWAMAELMMNPSAMAKARTELAQVVGSRPDVEESDIAQLRYLQAVVKETFRMHPAQPLLLPHHAETATRICGGAYAVPKGTRVLVNVWAIGHDPKSWPEPERFMPERFLAAEEGGGAAAAVDFRGRDFELLPFGSGRRMCPGMPLALRMVHLMLASLLHRFEWRLPDGKKLDMSERLGLNLYMATPLQAMATPVYN